MSLEFDVDNEWQLKMRDAILKPYYERLYRGRYQFIEYGEGGTDTIIANGDRVDEKIVRWPRNEDGTQRDEAYTAFALETMSCTVEGRERVGWMKTNTVQWLLYCFSSRDESALDCYMLDSPALQKWFWAQDHEQWSLWTSKQINRTQCRIVPISDVIKAVKFKRVQLGRPHPPGFVGYDNDGHFVHYCKCGAWGSKSVGAWISKGQMGEWFCPEHYPKEQSNAKTVKEEVAQATG